MEFLFEYYKSIKSGKYIELWLDPKIVLEFVSNMKSNYKNVYG